MFGSPWFIMSSDDSISKREEKIIQKARNAIGETDKTREETLQMIRDWMQKQPHLSHIVTGECFLSSFHVGLVPVQIPNSVLEYRGRLRCHTSQVRPFLQVQNGNYQKET